MRSVALVLLCLACMSPAHRVQKPEFQGQDVAQQQALATLLLASNPSLGFTSLGPAARPSLSGKRSEGALMRNRITFTPQRGHEFDEKINQLAAFLFRFASPKAVPDEIDFLEDLNCKDEEFEWFRQITEEFFQVEFTDEEAAELRNCGNTRKLVKDKGGHIWPEGLIPELGGLKGEGYKGRPEDAGTGKLD
mmetsp:Transcript_113569/g.200512  ORF Transcript_113569/g.200512 Transcript_113569/m.200512 type:complete len:192 (+) Transcript_113569:95-670(+)